MLVSDFDYNLPEELIAQYPAEPRDHSRLLLINRATSEISHGHFYDIVNYINEGDLIIVNDTKVIPARLFGHKKPGGMKVELFLIEELEEGKWKCMVRPGKKIQKGDEIVISPKEFEAEIVEFAEKGERIVEFKYNGSFEENLNRFGVTPLPPYIIKARKHEQHVTADQLPPEQPEDREHYQTVYANIPGSVAAPTAGLHFTQDLITKLKNKGVNFAPVTLHVSAGTFLPIKTDKIEDHVMHTEIFSISDETIDLIKRTRQAKKRIIPVGTTSVRSLESTYLKYGETLKSLNGNKTSIFICPGFKFNLTDAMVTNFHLPKSTLLMLVSAFAGYELIMKAYQTAVESKYRFYSYGDAMFIY